ncbi:MAG: alpha/beta hydrolase [Neomegalonema sp.]|nr:alpha/beta hydrolase [Neomegalonema sp.]
MTSSRFSSQLQPFGSPAPETLAFNAKLAAVFEGAPLPEEVPIEAMRALRAEGKGVLPIDGPLPEGAWQAYDAAAYGAPGGAGRVRVVSPEAAPRGVYYYLHGGGWTFGAPEQHDGQALRIAQATGMEVWSAQYRLAPEDPWPAGAEDCLAGLRCAIDYAQKIGGAPLFIGGSSAGAHYAAVALQRLRALGQFDQIAGAVMIYGVFDLAFTPSAARWGDRIMVLSTPIIDWFVGNLLPDRALAMTEAVSPLHADWSDAPPALFQVGTEDPLLDDTLFMAERWRAAGAPAELAVFPGGIHAFDVFYRPEHGLPIAQESEAATAAFLNARLEALGR